ncbi:DegT/DnrJ/EryC1/StrS family aminotransferase [Nonomuraea typhae]|uniref:DegT/DnrJ/EryC1/StrS family aminotransferase n=1 Tax=Nonomuraea typhae TaxID=2603600 RepID=UPI0015E1D834|nr:DegT/DnrJ/EryC1/StrS family aminotransferase [Nonomuraea typhae]
MPKYQGKRDDVLLAPLVRRTGRPAVYLPSARLGLCLALRALVEPGQRVLMSPVNCETVLFAAVAAGLRPVMAPLSPDDATIDAARVDWSGIGAVVATHMYGLPGQIARLAAECAARGVVLVEDCAHAFQTSVAGRHVGTFGAAASFSLSKHPRAGAGGVLVLREEAVAERVAAMRDDLLLPPATGGELRAVAGPLLRDAVYALRLSTPAWRLARALGIEATYVSDDSRARDLAAVTDGELPAFDRWLSVGSGGYRTAHGGVLRRFAAARQRTAERERERRVRGVRLLAGLPVTAPPVRELSDQPLFRVPLLVEERDAAIAALERRGVITTALYMPPLDEDFGPVTEPGPTPELAAWWTRHVLPVDPLQAARALPVLRTLTSPVRPSVRTAD